MKMPKDPEEVMKLRDESVLNIPKDPEEVMKLRDGSVLKLPKDPEEVMKLRDGSVLKKMMILKSDYLPKSQKTRLSPKIQGAPNYHKAHPLRIGRALTKPTKLEIPLHGVAASTQFGIINVLKQIGAKKKILWINMKDEPVVYINFRPFVVRNGNEPFKTLREEGINSEGVDQLEARLKEDILVESSRYGNKILVTDETPDGQMVEQWEPVSDGSLKTLLEVYEELQSEGYLVQYERVPIMDEKSPKATDYDTLCTKVAQADINTEIVFSCQMGRGLTTTAMVIAALIYFKRIRASDEVFDIWRPREMRYPIIKSLIELLKDGIKIKNKVEMAIDTCAEMQDLGETVSIYGNSTFCHPDEKKRHIAFSLFTEHLERYYFVVCFAAYLDSEGDFLQSDFAGWMESKPELYTLLRRSLRGDPLGALIVPDSDTRDEMARVTAIRRGKVLKSKSILKSDFNASCASHISKDRLQGAVSFREIHGFPIYGSGNPTQIGIVSALETIRSLRNPTSICWYNLIDEPVVYINGTPFVVRDEETPFSRSGICHEKLEEREDCLKEEVLKEAELYNGAVMVAHETGNGYTKIFYGGEHIDSEIFYRWEHIDSVLTPLEVYESIQTQDEDYSLRYVRIPVGDTLPPEDSFFDSMVSSISSDPEETLVFSSQMGRGRAIMATVIALLVRLRRFGIPLKILYESLRFPIYEEDSLSDGEESFSDQVPIARERSRRRIRKKEEEYGCSDLEIGGGIEIDDLMGNLGKTLSGTRESLDAVIDRCSQWQNIRGAILQYRKLSTLQHVDPRVRSFALKRAAEYLKTYHLLMSFAAYVGSEFFQKMSFKDWSDERPELHLPFRPFKQEELIREVTTHSREEESKVDYISKLPKELVSLIMELLSAKEAARLSVVSKSFQNMITIIEKKEFAGTVDEILSLSVTSTRMKIFSLNCQEDIGSGVDINKCLGHVLKLGVMDLELIINGMDREMWEWSGVVSSKTLERLTVRRVTSEEIDGHNLQRITFDTPSLTYLDYADFVQLEYNVNMESLVEARLSLQLVTNPLWDSLFPYDLDRYSSNPANLIKGLKNVQKLELSSSFDSTVLVFFHRAIPKFEKLQHVTMAREAVDCLPFLLDKTPNLKTLIIKGKTNTKQKMKIKAFVRQKLQNCVIQFSRELF